MGAGQILQTILVGLSVPLIKRCMSDQTYLASQTSSVGSQPATPSRSDSGHWQFFSNDSSDCGEVIYESKALSEPIRLTKNGRVLGFAINFITESNLAVWTSEGKIYLLQLQGK